MDISDWFSFVNRDPLTSQSYVTIVRLTLQLKVALDPSVALTDVGVFTKAEIQTKKSSHYESTVSVNCIYVLAKWEIKPERALLASNTVVVMKDVFIAELYLMVRKDIEIQPGIEPGSQRSISVLSCFGTHHAE